MHSLLSSAVPFIALPLLAAVIALVGYGASAQAPCRGGCNIVVIVVDTLGAKHIQSYGYLRETMPRTARFFEKGAVFEEAYAAAPWTLPSFASIFFSDLPHRVTYADLEPGARPNLVSALRDADFAVKAVLVPNTIFIADAVAKPFREGEALFDGRAPFTTAGKVLAQLASERDPFLLFVHTFEVHDPYQPGEPYNTLFDDLSGYDRVTMNDLLRANATTTADAERDRAYELRYDQGLRAADDRIADFLESIPDATLKNTAIILTADHGEAFGEHGKVWHANGLYDEELHVPLFIRAPGLPQKRIAQPVSLLDLAPTILSLAGVPAQQAFTGRDLTPLMRRVSFARAQPIAFVNGFPFYLAESSLKPGLVPPTSLAATGAEGSPRPLIDATAFGVRLGRWKLFSEVESEARTLHLFNLDDNPEEKNDRLDMLGAIPRILLEKLVTIEAGE